MYAFRYMKTVLSSPWNSSNISALWYSGVWARPLLGPPSSFLINNSWCYFSQSGWDTRCIMLQGLGGAYRGNIYLLITQLISSKSPAIIIPQCICCSFIKLYIIQLLILCHFCSTAHLEALNVASFQWILSWHLYQFWIIW